MSDKNKKPTSSFARLFMLFSAIMLFFLALTAHNTSLKLNQEQQKQADQSQITSLDEIIAATATETFIKDRFASIFTMVDGENFSLDSLGQKLNRIKSEFKTEIKCFYYEGNKLLKSFGATQEELGIFTKLMYRLHLQGEEFMQAQREAHTELLNRFGPGNRLELVRDHRSKVMSFNYLRQKQFFFWDNFGQNRSVFLIATAYPDFLERFRLIRKNLGKKETGAGVFSRKLFEAPHNISEDQMLAAKIKANISGKSTVKEFGLSWSFVEDENGQFYCSVAPIIKHETSFIIFNLYVFNFSSFMCALFLVIYLCSVFNVFPGRNLCEWIDAFSIRLRIIGLFAMASIFPVIFTALIGATSLSERAEIIENQAAGESIANLNRLESMISSKIEQSEKMAGAMRKKIASEPANEEFFLKHLRDFGITRSFSRLEVRDGNGVILFTTDDREVHGVTEAMDMFSRVALKQHAPHRLGKNAGIITPAEIVSESVLSTDEIGMATILRQRGRQWIFRMGTFPTLWFYDVFPELATGPAFMHYTAQMIMVYNQQVEETLALEKQNFDNLQLSTQLNFVYNNRKIYPKISGLDEEALLNAALVSVKTGKVLFRETSINDVPYWVAIKPEKTVNGHVFFNLISKPERLAALLPLKRQFVTAASLALMVAFAGAMLLIRLFIKPIGDISQGITAIRERQHDFSIEVTRNDEFGVLSNAFNKVIEELKELEYGRIVQASLLPEKVFIPEGYDLACFRTSATDLAGDYHDVLPLDDGRVAIILGDVTGHGISAALAMAMAKASVDYLDLTGKAFPTLMMDQLNALFNRELKPRHKFMTLVTMVLNPESGELIFDNAGQSYPYYFIAQENRPAEIKIPSMPLGATKKRRSKPETRLMQAGDAVILYSDGIIECSNPNEEMFGYERFAETFLELLKKDLNAQELLSEMMSILDNFRKPGPYPDDVTLVLLKKL